MSNPHLALHFFLQLAVILVVCRAVGALAARVGQPLVVAEMLAGVMLGPSLFGALLPDWQQVLFPWDPSQQERDTQSYLYPAAQLGLALYMFVVGAEFHVDDFRRARMKSSIAVSLAGILAPMLLGAALAWGLHHHTDLFPEKTGLAAAMLFMGASMSITALPVLARILHHKRLTHTTIGTVSLGAGAMNDAVAWGLLAVVLASEDNNWGLAAASVAGGVAYVAIALLVVRPLLIRSGSWMARDNGLTEAGLVAGLALMAAGAWFTDLIGLHAVFGAFVMGLVMPRGVVAQGLIARIQPLTTVLLLPLFFTYSGLNTRITLLDSGFLWLVCGAVLAVAILGKGVACWLAARSTGIPNREAMGIGTLMNARGLMELIIINIGLQRGIISEGLFATLVVMALVTTVMASPVFDLVMGRGAREALSQPGDPAPDMVHSLR